MKVLIDCSNIRSGGALQNGLAFLKFAHADQSHEWHAAVSPELAAQVPEQWVAGFNSFTRCTREVGWKEFWRLGRSMRALERVVRPDAVFSLAGPAYWRAKCTHIMGFAKPQYLYPEINIFYRLDRLSAFRERVRRGVKLAVQRRLFQRADYLVGQTQSVQRRGTRALNFPEGRFLIVRNSYSPLFRDSVAAHASDSQKTASQHVVFVPSAYYLHKNLEFVPEVAAVLRGLGLSATFRLTLPERSAGWISVSTLAARLNVGRLIETIGPVRHADLAAEYLRCSLVFLPTLLECSTAVYPEAMSAGIPIVTSDFDFAREACGEAALYCDPFDSSTAAARVAEALIEPQARARLLEMGPVELERRFPSPETKFAEQLAVLNRVSGRAPHAVPSAH